MRRSQVLGGAVALLLLAGAAVAVRNPTTRHRDENLVGDTVSSSLSVAGDTSAASADAAPLPAGGSGGSGAVARQSVAAPEIARVVKTASLTVSLAKSVSVTKAVQRGEHIIEALGGFTSNTQTRDAASRRRPPCSCGCPWPATRRR